MVAATTGYGAIVEILATKSALRRGVSRERATDLLMLYLGIDVYPVLVLDFASIHEDWIAADGCNPARVSVPGVRVR